MAIIFPPHPNDGDEITDINGQVFVYDAESNSWIHIGSDSDSSIVSLTADGIITPDSVDLLDDLQDASPLRGLKLQPNVEAYWYLLQSRFNYLDFRIIDDTINIEVNSNKLIRALSGYACPGTKGDTGIKGLGGADGTPGPVEGIHQPILGSDPNVLGIAVEVETPLDTSISIRFFENSNKLVEILLALNGATRIVDNTVNATIIFMEYDPTDQTVRGEVSGNWPENVNYKARQVGPTGLAGEDGVNFPVVRDHFVSDPSAYASSAITTMRTNSQSNILFARADITQNTSVPSLRSTTTEFATFPSTITSMNAPNPDLWASVEPTISEHKAILRWGFIGCFDGDEIPASCHVPDISFPAWNPHAVCHHQMPGPIVDLPGGGPVPKVRAGGQSVPQSTYDYTSFEWWGDDGPPFDLVLEDKPDDICCQEDAFYCTDEVSNCPRPGGSGSEGGGPWALIVDNL